MLSRGIPIANASPVAKRDPRFGPVQAAAALVVAAACAAISVALALSASTTGDYLARGAVAGDNAGPAITALSHGDLHGFFTQQPFMGLTSLVWRVPFVLLASIFAHENVFAYAAGAASCLIPTALLVLWLIQASWATRRRLAAGTVALILLASPVALGAVQSGHPEEILAATLATAAVLTAGRGSDTWSGLLLGLAIGTKQWAVIAVAPVLLATEPHRRLRTAVIATPFALLLSAAAPLADVAAYTRASRLVGASHTANVASLWWPVSVPLRTPAGASVAPTARFLPARLTRSDALLVVFGLAVAALAVALMSRRGPARPRVDALAFLALLGLVRCIADPGDLSYYFLATIVPMTAWEVASLGRAPIAAVIAVGAVTLTFDSSLDLSPALLNGLLIAWTAGLGCYLARVAISSRASGQRMAPVAVTTQAHAPSLR